MVRLKDSRQVHVVRDAVMGQGIMLSAFDYALGRATYMPSVIAGVLKDTARWLTRPQREYVTSTIRERVAEHTAGWDCDEQTWLGLAGAIEQMATEPEDGEVWTPGSSGFVLFPPSSGRLGLDDWWCMVGSAQRYDFRGDGRLAIGDYRDLVSLNLSDLNEKWRLNLMRDVEDAWRDSQFFKTAYVDDSKTADEYYVWLESLEIDESKAKTEYLDSEYWKQAHGIEAGGEQDASTEEES